MGINHVNLESDSKRIAKEIMAIASDPSNKQFDDMISFGKVDVVVSGSLLKAFNTQRKEYIKEINKNLKGCSVKLDTVGYGHGFFILFKIEFDDVDCETEDW